MKHDLNAAVDRLGRHILNTAVIVLMLVWLKDSEAAKAIRQVLAWWPIIIPGGLFVVLVINNIYESIVERRRRADPAAWRKKFGYDE